MALCISTTSRRRSTGRIGQGAVCGGSQLPSRRPTSIHILNDDCLLHVFHLCRPFFSVGDDIGGSFGVNWRSDGYWWYTLAHVCQRWRNIILGSATYLGLSLFCTYGTPVADMLAHSPALPLDVGYYLEGRELTTEDEDGIILAFKQHDRVRRVRLNKAITIMQKLFVVMDVEYQYPILEFLYITPPVEDNSTIWRFPGTFQAPHLRLLSLGGFALPVGSLLLTTAVGLVTLHLAMIHPSTYFDLNTLLQWISLMPQLETLKIYFEFSTPNRDVQRQLTHTSIIAPVTLPNLRYINFRGVVSYLEALVHWITTPRLEKLLVQVFNQLTFSVPRLLQFLDVTPSLRLDNAVLNFRDELVGVAVYPHGETNVYALDMVVKSWHLDWQVSSMAHISNSLGQIFSAVERLVLQHDVHSQSSEEHNEVERTEWRKLLRPFRNVKSLRIQSGLAETLRTHNGLVKDLSRCLQLEDEELPLELLPELRELEYYDVGDTRDAFTPFIDARRNAGRPVTLVRL